MLDRPTIKQSIARYLSFSIACIIAITGYLVIFPATVSATGDASFSLSPASGTYKKGSIMAIDVYESSSETINVADAIMKYNVSQIQFVSIDTSKSAFDIPVPRSSGNGTVEITRGKFGGTSGRRLLGRVNFKALVSSGSTAVTFDLGSNIQTQTTPPVDVWNGNPKGGTYSFASVTKPPPSDPTPKPVATSAPTTPRTSSNTKSSSTKLTPIPKQVKTYPVAIIVVDELGKAINSAQVTIDGDVSVTTDVSGTASFIDISVGEHSVIVHSKKQTVTQNIKVADTTKHTVPQQFKIVVKQPANPSWLKYIVATLGLLVLLVIFARLLRVLKRRHSQGGLFTNAIISTTPLDDGPPKPGSLEEKLLSFSPPPKPTGIISPTNKSQDTK